MVKSNFVEDFTRFSEQQLLEADPNSFEYVEVLRLIEKLKETLISYMDRCYELDNALYILERLRDEE